MRLLVCLTIAVLCLGQPADAQENAYMGALVPSAQPFDVVSYDVTMRFNDSIRPVVTGRCTTTIEWSKASAESGYIFHLEGLRVDSMTIDGRAVTAQYRGATGSEFSHYFAKPTSSVPEGALSTIVIWYSGTMTSEGLPGNWGGVSAESGTIYALGVGFSAPYVSATRHWLPCYDHPGDKALFKATFVTPPGRRVASNGLLEQVQVDGQAAWQWSSILPMSTYLMTFAMGPYIMQERRSEGYLEQIFTLRNDSTASLASYRLVKRMYDTFSRLFGAYPFEKVGYVNTTKGAMEHQTMISMPVSLIRSRDTVNLVGAHELAHQWFGDAVSPVDFRDAWLNESFATFCESLWMEELRGRQGYIADQQSKLRDYVDNIRTREGVLSLYDFDRKPPSSNYPQTIYKKGALVLGMLRYAMGDSAFFSALRRYATKYRYANASTSDLKDVLIQSSDQDIETFFRQWVYGKGFPILEIDTSSAPAGSESKRVIIRQVQDPEWGIFVNVPLEIGLVAQDFSTESRVVFLRSQADTFFLESTKPVRRIVINSGQALRSLVAVRSITSVEQEPSSDAARMRVFPNPLSNDVTIEFLAGAERADVKVYDHLGKIVLTETLDTQAGEVIRSSIDLSGLAAGTYTVVLISGKSQSQARIVR